MLNKPWPASVLIVDDLPTMRRIFKNLFLELGATNISEAAEVAGVLEYLRQGAVDLLVVSVGADYAEDLDLIRSMRADPSLANIAVLANARKWPQTEAALRAGADGYIGWPLTVGILRQKIGLLMSS